MANKTLTVTEKTSIVNISSPKAMKAFAQDLEKFIVDNKLFTDIKGKDYVHVEGWQFAGASLGIFPIVEKVENVSNERYMKYRAEVKLIRIADGTTVGYGVALCSNMEEKKKSFDEYAIASMAQTRAVGKAFRLSIGWIMKLAGYETTTAEEMDGVKNEQNYDEDDNQVAQSSMPIDDVKFLVNTKLATMPASEKIRFLKDNTGKINEKMLTDGQYRNLYEELTKPADL